MNSDESKSLVPPEETAGDSVHAITKLGLSSLGPIGGPLAELLGWIKTPFQRRQLAWMQDVAERLQAQERELKNFKAEEVAKNQMCT